jgi:hypothetical protein
MVSATVDKDICEFFFGKNKVKFYECKKARYKGSLIQFHDKSMSRSSIDANPGIIKIIRKFSGFLKIITFKKYNIGDLWFGNTAGCDHLKGQNIDVVGTPYHAEFLYKLFPFSLGIDFDKDEKMKRILVFHNGYKFFIRTYENEILRKFHFWMLESELEQAVGRARLLRFNCIVHVFSNFPLSQAVMKKFDYESYTKVK